MTPRIVFHFYRLIICLCTPCEADVMVPEPKGRQGKREGTTASRSCKGRETKYETAPAADGPSSVSCTERDTLSISKELTE